MSEFVYPQDVLPDMQYTEPEIRPDGCGTCIYGYVTNAGAYIPGYHCRLMERFYEELGIKNGSTVVDKHYGHCRHYKHWREAEQEAEAKQMEGAGI